MHRPKVSARPHRKGRATKAAVAVVLGIALGGTAAPIAGSANDDPPPLSVLVDEDVVEAREDLAEAEADAAEILADAQAEADADLADAKEDYDKAVAEIDKDLAEAEAKGGDKFADAQEEAAKDLAKADKDLAEETAKIDEKLAKAQSKADNKVTKALDKIERLIEELQQGAEVDPNVAKATEKLAKAEAKAAEALAEAQAEADADLTDAQEDYLRAVAKIDANLAEAEAAGGDEFADAQELAADELADADKDLAKAAEKAADKIAKEQAKADDEIAKVTKELDAAEEKAAKEQEKLTEKLARLCSSSLGYDAERTVGSMYNINQFIGADEAWDDGHTGAGIDVAVIDTGTVPVQGLDGDKVIYGPDFSLESPSPEAHQLDTYGHGTHMAGIIAGNDYDTEDEELTPGEFQGVAPDARIVSVKVADATGSVDPSQVIAAIDWVIAHRNDNGMNIRVINLSYSTASDQSYTIDPLAKAVENAWDAGIVVVAAAGNDGKDAKQVSNPAFDPYVIAVSAILDKESKGNNCRKDKTKWETTDYASEASKAERQPDIYAPGSTVVSLRNPGSFVDQAFPDSALTDRFTKATGTSQSTAVVSGAVALLLDARPELTPDEVKAILIASADSKAKVRVLDIEEALDQNIPEDAEQTWERSTGLGSLEATRGGSHVIVDGNPLTGENTVFGPWEPEQWVDSSLAGSSWTGSSWTGSSWTGSSWTGSSWTGSSWTGSSWTGSSWTGSSWTGSSWTGSSWTGSSWTGSSWSGANWS